MLEAKQSGNVVEDFTIGNTRIKICDDFCRTRTSGEVKEILDRVARRTVGSLTAALKRKMEIAAVAFFCTVTALIAVYSCATTAAANLAQQTAATPVTEYVTLAYMEVQPETEQEPELLYDVPMSDELQRYVREQAERQGVPFEIALAVIERESSYQPDAVSDTGDFGLMQINVCNHRWLYEELGITDVMDPEQNIEAGLYILGQAFQKYDDPDKALMAYNMGDSGMKAAWSKGQHSSKYSRAVIETAQALKRKEH